MCLCMVVVFTACGQPENQFVGKWSQTKIEQCIGGYPLPTEYIDVTDILGASDTIVIKNGGDLTITHDGVEYTGKWTDADDSYMYFTLEDEESPIDEEPGFTYDEDTDTIKMVVGLEGSYYLTFERK